MRLRFRSLGSGSSGNATLVETGRGSDTSRVLIDCGFSMRELASRLARAGSNLEAIDAVFVTHEHGDHVGCAVTLSRRHRIPLWMSRGTWRAIGEPELDGLLNFARDAEPIAIRGLQLQPYTVPHDALEPLQLRCSNGAQHLGVLTDAGAITPHLLAHLQGCHGLLLECNHDREMLAGSSYPYPLKARIGGRFGHLSNDTSAAILAACTHAGLQHLVAAHLSERNNTPEHVRVALTTCGALSAAQLTIADPLRGCDWIELD